MEKSLKNKTEFEVSVKVLLTVIIFFLILACSLQVVLLSIAFKSTTNDSTLLRTIYATNSTISNSFIITEKSNKSTNNSIELITQHIKF